MDSYEDIFERKKSAVKFKEGLIHELMKLYTTNHKTKIGNEGLTAVNEIMLKFLNEIVWRAMNQAHNEGLNNVNLDHIEKILPQLLLDFA
ncbi:centromere protein X-like [Daphnia pulex]|uniref:centromere protein X-like n=1 Tax=Daphnia pulex TaxID=6669 RepID=UPI001EDFBAE8|nr:centromere protein X-like [Daphnia pulex]